MFESIKFGFASARKERVELPDLLVNGFLDINNITKKILNESIFLILGNKGSGKSLLGERIDLISSQGQIDDITDKAVFSRLISLSDFPFKSFYSIISGKSGDKDEVLPSSWAWILVVYILELLNRDQMHKNSDPEKFCSAIEVFRQMGISPEMEPRSIVNTSSKKNFRIQLPLGLFSFGTSDGQSRPTSDIPDFVDGIKTILSKSRSENSHLLLIDGLDDIMTSTEAQYKSLSALIFESEKLNTFFLNNNVPVKIVIFFRTDMYENIPGPNKNKIRTDFSFQFDWYHDPKNPKKSLLLEIANKRASLHLNRECNVMEEFFPEKITNLDCAEYLLNFTRHTPRDFLQLLTFIQKYYQKGKLSYDQINSGVREYSLNYFLPEIKDEMAGYAENNILNNIISTFTYMGVSDFHMSELLQSYERKFGETIDSKIIISFLKNMFNCSAIGNIISENGNGRYYSYKFRSRNSDFDEGKKIQIHRGLRKALNIK